MVKTLPLVSPCFLFLNLIYLSPRLDPFELSVFLDVHRGTPGPLPDFLLDERFFIVGAGATHQNNDLTASLRLKYNEFFSIVLLCWLDFFDSHDQSISFVSSACKHATGNGETFISQKELINLADVGETSLGNSCLL